MSFSRVFGFISINIHQRHCCKRHPQILDHFVIYALTTFHHVFLVRPGTKLYPFPFQLTEIALLMLCQLLSFGHEHASSEIKIKTCIEMTLNESFYTKAHSATNIPLVSGSFKKLDYTCCKHCRLETY